MILAENGVGQLILRAPAVPQWVCAPYDIPSIMDWKRCLQELEAYTPSAIILFFLSWMNNRREF